MQQQEGNGLIGGGIGGAIGLGGAYFGGAKALSNLVNEEYLWDSHQKFYNDLKRKYKVGDEHEVQRSVMTGLERQTLEGLDDRAILGEKKMRSRVRTLAMLGVPITTALLGSTLTD